MSYILYGNGSAPSGRTLRRLLSCRGGLRAHYERNLSAASDLLIRYGVSAGPDAPTTLNRAEAVALAANKALAFQALQAAGVTVPPFARRGELDALDSTGAILGRSNFGSGGEDITVYRPGEVPGRHQLYTQFVPSDHEMRIHVFQGAMIHAQIKQYRGEGDPPEYPIRNHSRGYVFVPYVRTRPNQSRVDAAVAACNALGLDFGAVDVLVGQDGRTYVLEVNTGAGLSPRTALAYGRAIEGWCRGQGINIDLDTDSVELDSDEEACYNEGVEATSPAEQAIPAATTTDSVDAPVGQDRARTDEREAASKTRIDALERELRAQRERIATLERDLATANQINDARRARLVQVRDLASNLLGEV